MKNKLHNLHQPIGEYLYIYKTRKPENQMNQFIPIYRGRTTHTALPPTSKSAAYGYGAYSNSTNKAMYVRSSKPDYTYFGARYGACPDEGGNSGVSVWLSVDPLSDMYPSTSPFIYVRGNPVMLVDPNGMSDGWVENEGKVFWDGKTNSKEEFDKNYEGKTGYSYVSDADNPNSYTLPSGEGKLIMDKWVSNENIEDGRGSVQITMTFEPSDENSDAGWIQTYSTNEVDVNSDNIHEALPQENLEEFLDGYGVQQSSDISLARYFDGFYGYGKANKTLDDMPLRAYNTGAERPVVFNAQSTLLINGNRVVSLGWGFVITSGSTMTANVPVILKTTSDFHNRAVNSLGNKIKNR
jgi:hypothetical protein